MAATIEDLETWVDEMMKKRDIASYKLDVSGSTSKGDGYLGEVNFIKVVANLEKGKEKVYNIVVKSANKNEEFRKKTPIQEAYHREMFMYTKVFPILAEFQRQYALETIFDNFAKCYSVCNTDKKEALVLKNLKTAGFVIHDRTIPQNLEHALFVFRSYAKFHGTCLALKTKKPALFESLTKNMSDVLAQFVIQSGFIPVIVEDFKKARALLAKEGNAVAAKKLQCVEEEIEYIMTRMSREDMRESVILHGDCWNNNMMFKYENGDTSQPVDMRFIDFQLSRVASPIFDLSYYLYSIADKTVLQHFDVLLQAYHQSLRGFLKQIDISCDDIVSLDDLRGQWNKQGRFGLVMAAFIIKLELCQSDEVVDLAMSAEKGDMKDAFNIELKDNSEYERRVKEVFEHFAEKFM